MRNGIRCALLVLVVAGATAVAADNANPFIGRWALTIPGGGAGWLGVADEGGVLTASILWGGGSVMPTNKVFVDGDTLNVVRLNDVERKDASGKTTRVQVFGEMITAKVTGDEMKLTQIVPNDNGKRTRRADFTGKRIAALPAKPDLTKVKFGQPIKLFNGTNLDGWKLTDANAKSGWSVENGVMTNRPTQEEGKPHINYGNLRTAAEFEDFNLKLETNIPKGGNSGVYLRGIYEIQVADTAGRGLDSHNMGGLYSRITPKVSAEKPAGEWQTMDITLCDRHLTVKLNGQMLIDNEPIMGCTGGALWSDEFKPGPIYLQGDHTGINYRNIVLTPIVK
jgi:hypothetical protein